MSKHIIERSKLHKVEHEFSGNVHFFKVTTPEGETYPVSIKVNCDCKYMGAQGIANGKICSHILAVFKAISDKGKIQTNEGEIDE